VLVVSSVIVTSVLIADVVLAGIEYDVPEPMLSHDFPETIYFYNISEGVTSNRFSIIFDLSTNHSGHHHIVPREFSVMFCFRDNDSGVDLFQLIWDVDDGLRNGTFSYANHDYDRYWRYVDSWWIPSHIWFALNERPEVNLVRCGILFDLMLINSFGNHFDGHDINVQLRINVTYSRWWHGIQVSSFHQIISYVFDLTDDGVAVIQGLVY
jgi:hypothetical protein